MLVNTSMFQTLFSVKKKDSIFYYPSFEKLVWPHRYLLSIGVGLFAFGLERFWFSSTTDFVLNPFTIHKRVDQWLKQVQLQEQDASLNNRFENVHKNEMALDKKLVGTITSVEDETASSVDIKEAKEEMDRFFQFLRVWKSFISRCSHSTPPDSFSF